MTCEYICNFTSCIRSIISKWWCFSVVLNSLLGLGSSVEFDCCVLMYEQFSIQSRYIMFWFCFVFFSFDLWQLQHSLLTRCTTDLSCFALPASGPALPYDEFVMLSKVSIYSSSFFLFFSFRFYLKLVLQTIEVRFKLHAYAYISLRN